MHVGRKHPAPPPPIVITLEVAEINEAEILRRVLQSYHETGGPYAHFAKTLMTLIEMAFKEG